MLYMDGSINFACQIVFLNETGPLINNVIWIICFLFFFLNDVIWIVDSFNSIIGEESCINHDFLMLNLARRLHSVCKLLAVVHLCLLGNSSLDHHHCLYKRERERGRESFIWCATLEEAASLDFIFR